MNGTAVRSAPSGAWPRPPSPTLVRYILRELAAPTLMGFGLFTFFMLMNVLLGLAELIIRDRIPATDVGLLFLYNVPHVIVLTVPMAVLVGGLLAFGRLSTDSEIIAMRSSGVSLYQLTLPILLVGLGATTITFYLTMVAMPWGNNATIQHQWRLINTRTLVGEIRPRVFETRFDNFILWIDDVDSEQQSWKRMMLARTDVNPAQLFMAEAARLRYSPETHERWLELDNGYQYSGGGTAEESSVTAFRGHEATLGRALGDDDIKAVDKTERMMNLGELRARVRERREAGQPFNIYAVEIHKKFAIPAACLVMALIAVPLGASTRRHTKATGYLIAIVVIAVYYMFIDGGEKFADEGAVSPWLGVWAANLVIGAAALILLWNRAREKDFRIVDTALAVLDRAGNRVTDLWHAWRGEAGPSEEIRRQNLDDTIAQGRRFPRILDLYVLSQFTRIFAMTLGGLMIIWLIGEYFEISDDFYAAGVGGSVIVDYFRFRVPFIVTMTIPVATILTVLIVFSLMSKNNEVVAVLAGGISLFRLAAPVLIPVATLTVVQYAVSDYIAPYTNQRAEEIKSSVRGGTNYALQPAQGNWMRGQGTHFFSYADYDAQSRTFQGLRIYYLDGTHWRLSRMEYAARAAWSDGRWLATDAWRRHYRYSEDGTRITSPPLERFATLDPLPIDELPDYFDTEQRLPEQMSAAELSAYITNLEERGFDASKYKIDLQQKFAFPAVVLVLAMVGIPFGFRMGRQGTLSGVAVALALTAVFWLTFVFFRALGAAETLPPVAAAWAPHVLFLALAGYITAGLKT